MTATPVKIRSIDEAPHVEPGPVAQISEGQGKEEVEFFGFGRTESVQELICDVTVGEQVVWAGQRIIAGNSSWIFHPESFSCDLCSMLRTDAMPRLSCGPVTNHCYHCDSR